MQDFKKGDWEGGGGGQVTVNLFILKKNGAFACTRATFFLPLYEV